MQTQIHLSSRLRGSAPARCAAALAAGLAFVSWPLLADTPPPAAGGRVTELAAKDLVGAPGLELRLLTVEYLPGGASAAHRHRAQVFVYVLEGSVRMQVQGAAAVTLGPGDVFYEGREDVHAVSANASATQPARLLVFMVKDKGQPVSAPAAAERTP